MGPKITVDSATMMNKGFEVIEVHHLFGVEPEKIEVIVHPQSVIHSMIEHPDGSMLAQMGVTDMYLPIMNVLSYPRRLDNRRFERLNLAELGQMTFEAPDLAAFPCLAYAYEAMRRGGTNPAVLNAANEVGVERFLTREIRFVDIPRIIEGALEAHGGGCADPSLEEIMEADRRAREWARGGGRLSKA
jgi:1-deoxy-D-xylulose-5-phosphate reductoisomerase